ncbi:MFS transporter [Paenibacillus sp. N1-5-1-14]|uniref:CynX/NimT family MFS transporter n=1 Tax=Paenibacillus radicibacter TaxID=2972488 RepID=UPI002158D782|nr:MFS transporter [Paenibacillus radicibacter]MCR8642853.1 MFS transporter [Paenibacillus radicibacter]
MQSQTQLNQSTHTNHSAITRSISSGSWMLIIGIILIGANLRAPLTSVGPLVQTLRDELHLSNTFAGMITTMPLIAFALLSPFAARIARKFGMATTLLAALLVLVVGIGVRSSSDYAITLFIGTILLGLAIAICNVLLPSLIKQNFSRQTGLMTGIYSVSMNLFGAIASGVSVPFAKSLGFGWKGALGIWAILAFVCVLLWLPQMRSKDLQATAAVNANQEHQVSLWKSPLAWKVTLFMGMQSMMFYVILTWFPSIIVEKGIEASSAGYMMSIMQMLMLPFTFIVPIIAGKMKDQRMLVVLTFVLFSAGLLGVWFGGSALLMVWMASLGIGCGFAFSLVMMFFSLRTRSMHEAAELSGMAQSAGYLMAAVGPPLFGFLHDVTHNWTIPLLILVAASIVFLIAGLGAGRNCYIGKGKVETR